MHEGQVKVERMSRGLHVLYSMYRTQVQHAEKLNPQLYRHLLQGAIRQQESYPTVFAARAV